MNKNKINKNKNKYLNFVVYLIQIVDGKKSSTKSNKDCKQVKRFW